MFQMLLMDLLFHSIAFAQDRIAETFTARTGFHTDFCFLSDEREGEGATGLNYY